MKLVDSYSNNNGRNGKPGGESVFRLRLGLGLGLVRLLLYSTVHTSLLTTTRTVQQLPNLGLGLWLTLMLSICGAGLGSRRSREALLEIKLQLNLWRVAGLTVLYVL